MRTARCALHAWWTPSREGCSRLRRCRRCCAGNSNRKSSTANRLNKKDRRRSTSASTRPIPVKHEPIPVNQEHEQSFMKSRAQIFVIFGAACFASLAQAAPPECAKPEKLETEMSESTYGALQASMELLSKKKYDEAIEKLAKIADSGSTYEKAVVNYNLGFAYSSKPDNASAVKAFAKSLSFNALPRQQREQLQYNLGQLYIVAGQHENGIKALQEYIAKACGAIPADAHIFLANALTE